LVNYHSKGPKVAGIREGAARQHLRGDIVFRPYDVFLLEAEVLLATHGRRWVIIREVRYV
jgi:hypothetical protein